MYSLYFLLRYAVQVVYAADSPIKKYCETLHPGCGAGAAFIVQLAVRVGDIITELMGGVAVIMFIWGAIRMVTSGGNDEGRTKGKNIMIASLIGVFFAIMANSILSFACNLFADDPSVCG